MSNEYVFKRFCPYFFRSGRRDSALGFAGGSLPYAGVLELCVNRSLIYSKAVLPMIDAMTIHDIKL